VTTSGSVFPWQRPAGRGSRPKLPESSRRCAPRGGEAATADHGPSAARDGLQAACDKSKFRRYSSRIISLPISNSPFLLSNPTLPFLEFSVTFPKFFVSNFKFFVTFFGANPYSMGLSWSPVTIRNSNSSLPPSARPGGSRGFPAAGCELASPLRASVTRLAPVSLNLPGFCPAESDLPDFRSIRGADDKRLAQTRFEVRIIRPRAAAAVESGSRGLALASPGPRRRRSFLDSKNGP
jgi:hypothetical protein